MTRLLTTDTATIIADAIRRYGGPRDLATRILSATTEELEAIEQEQPGAIIQYADLAGIEVDKTDWEVVE